MKLRFWMAFATFALVIGSAVAMGVLYAWIAVNGWGWQAATGILTFLIALAFAWGVWEEMKDG